MQEQHLYWQMSWSTSLSNMQFPAVSKLHQFNLVNIQLELDTHLSPITCELSNFKSVLRAAIWLPKRFCDPPTPLHHLSDWCNCFKSKPPIRSFPLIKSFQPQASSLFTTITSIWTHEEVSFILESILAWNSLPWWSQSLLSLSVLSQFLVFPSV